VVIGPGASSDVIAMRVTFGVLRSTDGGRTFRWMCEEGLYSPFVPRGKFDPPIVLAARRAVVFGYEVGMRYLDDTCTTKDVREARSRSFGDLTSDPTGRTLYAVEDTEGTPGAVYRGDGETMAFARQEAASPASASTPSRWRRRTPRGYTCPPAPSPTRPRRSTAATTAARFSHRYRAPAGSPIPCG